MARLKMKIDGHCPAYMLAAEPCGQTSPSPSRSRARCRRGASPRSTRSRWFGWTSKTRNRFSLVPITSLPGHTSRISPRIHAIRWQGRVLRRYQMRQVMMGVGLFTHDASLPVGQTAPGRKFPGALALPSDRDEARRYARACRSSQPGTFWAIQRELEMQLWTSHDPATARLTEVA